MTQTRYRVIFLLLGLSLMGVVVGAVVFTPSGRDTALPGAVENYAPTDGAIVLRQTRVVLDLEPGFEIVLRIDDTPIPADEIEVIEATGVFTWQPGPGRTFDEWSPGLHVVEASWERITGLPNPGSLAWSFRVQ